MMKTITIEFNDEEAAVIAKTAQKHGQTAEEYCQTFAKRMLAPENEERVTHFLESIIRKEKSRKFDQLVAEGMEPIYANYHVYGRILAVAVKPDRDYTLLVKFNNGEIRRLDCMQFICGIGAFLQNKADFYRVQVDEYGAVCWNIDPDVDSNIVWENKFDICPHEVFALSEPLETEEQ